MKQKIKVASVRPPADDMVSFVMEIASWDVSAATIGRSPSVGGDQSPKQEDRKYSFNATTSSFMTLLWPSFIQSGPEPEPKPTQAESEAS